MRDGEFAPGILRKCAPVILGMVVLGANACSSNHSRSADAAGSAEASVADLPGPHFDGPTKLDGPVDFGLPADSRDGPDLADHADRTEASVADLPGPHPDGVDLGHPSDSPDGPLAIGDASLLDGMPLGDARPVLDRGDDSPNCHYVTPPSVIIGSSDPSQGVSHVQVLDGPCSAMTDNLAYGPVVRLTRPDCPSSPFDDVVCKLEVTSTLGSTAIVDLPFAVQMFGGVGFYWSAGTTFLVTFPPRDGGPNDI